MKIVALGRHFWPDSTPASRLHLAVLEQLVRQGHSAVVFATQPSYNNIQHDRQPKRECRNGVDIVRIALLPERKHLTLVRLVNALYYTVRALFFLMRHHSDLIIVHTYPPVLTGLTAWLVNRLKGTPFIYHCMDVQPESARIAGKLGDGICSSAIYRALQRLDNMTCRAASAVVTLSGEMATTLKARGWDGRGLHLINNFHTDPAPARRQPDPNLLPEMPADRHLVVFAGNMGAFQGLDVVVQAADLLRDHRRIQFLFMGAGERHDQLKHRAGDLVDRTIHFMPFQPLDQAMAIVGQADLAVLSLLPEVFSTAVPSKTMMYLRAGCPMIALIEPDCELAQIIRDYHLGIVPISRDPEVVAQAILQDSERGSPAKSDRDEIIRVGEELYGYDQTLNKWSMLIEQLSETNFSLPPGAGERAHRPPAAAQNSTAHAA